jgi:hypothetical protein
MMNEADKNMIGGMTQDALIDYQDELRELVRIIPADKVLMSFFIVEQMLKIRGMFCSSVSCFREN